jgi:hypothetical protein
MHKPRFNELTLFLFVIGLGTMQKLQGPGRTVDQNIVGSSPSRQPCIAPDIGKCLWYQSF